MLWDRATGHLRHKHTLGDDTDTIAFSPNSELLATVSSSRTVKLWNTETGQLQQRYMGDGKIVGFSPDSKFLAIVCDSTTVELRSTGTLQIQQVVGIDKDVIETVSFSPDSKLLMMMMSEEKIQFWNIARRQLLQQTFERLSSIPAQTAFSPNSKLFALIRKDHTVQIWDTTTGTNE